MNVGELFVHLGVKADTYAVKDFARSIANLPLSVAGAITALSGMELGFMALTSHTLDMANNLNIFRAETGLSTNELQRWQHAAKQAGISGDSVTSSIMGISNAIVQITRFGNGAPAIAFGRLGITDWAKKNPFQLMGELRDRYQKMNPNEFRTYAGQLGIAPEMMRLFELSPSQFRGAMSSGPALGSGDLAAMADFQKELAHFTIVVEQSFVPVLRQLTPYLGDLAKAMSWLVQQMGGAAVAGIQSGKELVTDPKQYLSDMGSVLSYMLGQIQQSLAIPTAATINVTQTIMGVTSDADAHRAGAEHLKHELTRASKQMSKGH